MYIRAFQQGSDLDDTVEEKLLIGDRPKQTSPQDKLALKDRLRQRREEDLSEVIVKYEPTKTLAKLDYQVDARRACTRELRQCSGGLA